MLTIEVLRANAALSGLTDAQFSAIAEMSSNDEATVIGARIGALHGQYDKDILDISGVAKNESEKSYDYAKRVLKAYKAQTEDLQKKMQEGSQDEALKKQLKDAKDKISQHEKLLLKAQSDLQKAKEQAQADLQSAHVDFAFQTASSNLKFKADIPESLRGVLISAAKAEVLEKGKPEMQDGKLIFRDASGNVLNNPNNNLKPFTAEELLMQTSLKDIIDTGRQQPGAGTKEVVRQQQNKASLLDLSTAHTQVDADKIIEAHLLANGLTRDSSEFASQLLQVRTENNVSELPLR